MARLAARWGVLFLAVLGAACGGGGSASPPADGGPGADGAAPLVAAPDLRFKWVGSGVKMQIVGFGLLVGTPSTRTSFKGTNVPDGVAPLVLSGESLGLSDNAFGFSVPDLEPLNATGASGFLSNLESDLDQLVDARTIVVSLDTALADYGFYIAVLSGSQDGVMYQPYTRGMTTSAGLADWMATQLSPGQVVTALGPTTDGIFVAASGRDGDTTAYETQVVTATLDDLVSQLQGLAADGYVITAFGRDGAGTDGASTFVAVGARAPGQTAARTIMAAEPAACAPDAGGHGPDAPVQPMFDQGYALIGAVYTGTDCAGETPGPWMFIGER
ncbi:MAG TPA: hypothetical protein VKZ18_01685 [Polyangia bacterium]|nr:hypothetical protein [Polyangia bacterium]